VLGEFSLAPLHRVSPHRQEHAGRIDLERADRRAQVAEAALRGHGKIPVRLMGFGNFPGFAVFFQKRAFLLTKPAGGAFFDHPGEMPGKGEELSGSVVTVLFFVFIGVCRVKDEACPRPRCCLQS